MKDQFMEELQYQGTPKHEEKILNINFTYKDQILTISLAKLFICIENIHNNDDIVISFMIKASLVNICCSTNKIKYYFE